MSYVWQGSRKNNFKRIQLWNVLDLDLIISYFWQFDMLMICMINCQVLIQYIYSGIYYSKIGLYQSFISKRYFLLNWPSRIMKKSNFLMVKIKLPYNEKLKRLSCWQVIKILLTTGPMWFIFTEKLIIVPWKVYYLSKGRLPPTCKEKYSLLCI